MFLWLCSLCVHCESYDLLPPHICFQLLIAAWLKYGFSIAKQSAQSMKTNSTGYQCECVTIYNTHLTMAPNPIEFIFPLHRTIKWLEISNFMWSPFAIPSITHVTRSMYVPIFVVYFHSGLSSATLSSHRWSGSFHLSLIFYMLGFYVISCLSVVAKFVFVSSTITHTTHHCDYKHATNLRNRTCDRCGYNLEYLAVHCLVFIARLSSYPF